MSRFADQLPIVTEPTAANFLLGTDENDPRALVRIPAEGLGGGGSTEYTILDETALDVDGNIALSAGLYLYVGNAPANLDLSGLVDGERVEIINHTAYKVFLFGFNNWVWNGSTTALQDDKGLIIEKGGIIGAKHNENLSLFNTLPNGLSQSWREGLAPNYLELTYVSPGDANGIIYYLGATKYEASFQNPHTRGEIIVTSSSGANPQLICDRQSVENSSFAWQSGSGSTQWLKLNFINGTIRPNRVVVARNSYWGWTRTAGAILQGSNDDVNWDSLSPALTTPATGSYQSFLPTTETAYKYLRFYKTGVSDVFAMAEAEFYGTYFING
jgi:hypothetical protein